MPTGPQESEKELHRSAPDAAGAVGGLIMVVMASGIGLAGTAAIGQELPFTEEGWSRGIQYTMQNWPPSSGLWGYGMAVADLDLDGDEDLVLIGRSNGFVGIFENDGTGHFTNRSFTAGIFPLAEASVVLAFDHDGDRDLDLYFGQYYGGNRLYRNDGGFLFTDVTAGSGLGVTEPTKGGAVGDFDGDGWLDLYVSNYLGGHVNHLYRNNGDGTFTESATEFGVESGRPTLQPVWVMLDEGDRPDLYLNNDRGQINQAWLNKPEGFESVENHLGLDATLCSMGLAVGDVNGDRRPDFYITNVPTMSKPPMFGANAMLLSSPDGRWLPAEAEWGVEHFQMSWGTSWWDFDNDADLDLYVCNESEPNVLYRHDGGPPMTDVSTWSGLEGNDGTSFASAIGDLTGDGALDLVLNNSGSSVEFFRNQVGTANRWIRLRIAGEFPNWHGVGAVAEVRHGGAKQDLVQWGQVLVGGNAYLAQNEMTLHFGLGSDAIVDEIVVTWPHGGGQRVLTGLPADQVWTILPESRLGDLDDDGDVDAADRDLMLEWVETPLVPGREAADLDGDADLDRVDLSLLWSRAGWARTDLDGDGLVGGADLATLLGHWGSGDPIADVDGNGLVAGSDLAEMLGNWSKTK